MNIKQLGLFDLILVLVIIFLMWADQNIIRTKAFITILLPAMVLANYLKLIIQQDATKRTKGE